MDAVTFDAEALVAFFAAEPGADVTRHALEQVASGTVVGHLSEVNAAEVWYILKRHGGIGLADDHLAWLEHEACIRLVSSSTTWRRAARIKADHRMSLGDAFAFATAQETGSAILTGNDPEFDAGERLGIEVMRIRSSRGA